MALTVPFLIVCARQNLSIQSVAAHMLLCKMHVGYAVKLNVSCVRTALLCVMLCTWQLCLIMIGLLADFDLCHFNMHPL